MSASHLNLISFAIAIFWVAPTLAIEPSDRALTDVVPLKVKTEPEAKSEPEPPRRHVRKVTFLGIGIGPVPAELREQLELRPGEGVMIHNVLPDTAADDAGIEPMDLIHKIDGLVVHGPHELRTAIRNQRFGERITIDLIRGLERIRVNTTLGEREVFDPEPGMMQWQQVPPELLLRRRIELLPNRRFMDPFVVPQPDRDNKLPQLVKPRALEIVPNQIIDEMERLDRMRRQMRFIERARKRAVESRPKDQSNDE